MRIFSYTRPREAILDHSRWFLKRNEGWWPVKVCEGQKHGKSVIAHFDGIDDRDEAAELIECEIAISRDEMPAAEEGSYYWADLEGLRVVHRDGTELGHVAYMMETGANDVMVTAGERERLIPFIADKVVLGVDFEKGEISVDWEWD